MLYCEAMAQLERLRIRRAKRTDIPALRTLASPSASGPISRVETRRWRHLAGDPALDFYVAEQTGTVQGMLLVCYVRTLGSPGWQALLDMLVGPAAGQDIARALLNFAKARARKRGCQQLWGHRADRELLLHNGFATADGLLSCRLG